MSREQRKEMGRGYRLGESNTCVCVSACVSVHTCVRVTQVIVHLCTHMSMCYVYQHLSVFICSYIRMCTNVYIVCIYTYVLMSV